jgi:hypothetical protein
VAEVKAEPEYDEDGNEIQPEDDYYDEEEEAEEE